MRRESKIQVEIIRRLAGERRIRVWRNNTGSLQDPSGRWIQFGLVGSSDLLGILAPGGQLLAIEVKSETGKLSKEQRAFGEMVERFGGVYVVARSVADVESALSPWLTDTQKPKQQSSADGS